MWVGNWRSSLFLDIKSLNKFTFQGDLIQFKDYPKYCKAIRDILTRFSNTVQSMTIPEELVAYVPSSMHPKRIYYYAGDTNWPYRAYPTVRLPIYSQCLEDKEPEDKRFPYPRKCLQQDCQNLLRSARWNHHFRHVLVEWRFVFV